MENMLASIVPRTEWKTDGAAGLLAVRLVSPHSALRKSFGIILAILEESLEQFRQV
jgi:hypothetical protein